MKMKDQAELKKMKKRDCEVGREWNKVPSDESTVLLNQTVWR